MNQEGNQCDANTSAAIDGCESNNANANTGNNLQGEDLQLNGTVQEGAAQVGEPDAFVVGLLCAIALGGDASASVGNAASSENETTVANELTTGDATAFNVVGVSGSQDNTNSGWDTTFVLGSEAGSAIEQSNHAAINADDNFAGANSGGNLQGNLGQVNLTGQSASAGASGSSAVALSFGFGLAAGGNATAFAVNSGGGEDTYSNSQTVTNTGATGDALAANSANVGVKVKDDPNVAGDQSVDDPFVQSNGNTGSSYTAIASWGCFAIAGALIGQSNDIIVDPSGNAAEANSGYNLQASGLQLNGTGQEAEAGASGGSAHAKGLFVAAMAFGGAGDAAAANTADSSNTQDVSNSLTTGDATAQNFTGVNAEQHNVNGDAEDPFSGNVGALQALAVFGMAFGCIDQQNYVNIVADGNYADARTGYNGQFAGPQANLTFQGASAEGDGGSAAALGGFAMAFGGDGDATAGNAATGANTSSLDNSLTTGDASGSNAVNVDLAQTNENHGYAAGVAVLDIYALAGGSISQSNETNVDGSYNTAIADTGWNAQGSLGQLNVTLQGAYALAFGGCVLGIGGEVEIGGGNASALAVNSADSSNSQEVTNDATTGNASAINGIAIDLTQSNSNDGNADGIAKLAIVGSAFGAIGQSNTLWVYHDDNAASANSGFNLQFSGPQINVTGQEAEANAYGGGAFGLGCIVGATGGSAEAAAANTASSSNFQDVVNTLVTGDAFALNGVQVTAVQTNSNDGDANGKVKALELDSVSSSIAQSNEVTVSGGDNEADANTGMNAQVAGAQVNLTGQEAEAGASGGESVVLSVVGSGEDGAGTADAANVATSDNTSEVSNQMTTGDATAINQVTVDVTQQNDNTGSSNALGL